MNELEKLLQDASDLGIEIDYINFKSDNLKGLCVDKSIALSNRLKTASETACILAEELGHYHTTVGDILDQSNESNRKQEKKAHRWAVNKIIDFDKLYEAKLSGCSNRYELAEYLGITENFLQEALDIMKEIYGNSFRDGDYFITIEPFNIISLKTAKCSSL